MTFTRTITWSDGSGGGTPVSAARLNTGFQEAGDYADTAVSAAAPSYLTVTGGGKDTLQAHGNMGATETFDLALGNEHTGTLDANCTVTLTGATTSKVCTMTLGITMGGAGGFDITWPGSVTWQAGAKPYFGAVAVADTVYIVLFTYDGGTNWRGSHSTTDAVLAGAWDRPLLAEPWKMDDNNSTNNQVWGASGRSHFTFFRSAVTRTVGKFAIPVGGTAAGVPTTIRLGLFSVPESFTGNLTLLANSKNVATAQADTTEYSSTNVATTNVVGLRTTFLEYTFPFDTGSLAAVSSAGLIAGKLYCFGMAWAGTTQPGMYGKNGFHGPQNMHYGQTRAALHTGLADLTTSVTISSLTQTSVMVYCGFIA